MLQAIAFALPTAEDADAAPTGPAATASWSPAAALTSPDGVPDELLRAVTEPGSVQSWAVLALSAQYRTTAEPAVATVTAGAAWLVVVAAPVSAAPTALTVPALR
jgi:hypothetical protein